MQQSEKERMRRLELNEQAPDARLQDAARANESCAHQDALPTPASDAPRGEIRTVFQAHDATLEIL